MYELLALEHAGWRSLCESRDGAFSGELSGEMSSVDPVGRWSAATRPLSTDLSAARLGVGLGALSVVGGRMWLGHWMRGHKRMAPHECGLTELELELGARVFGRGRRIESAPPPGLTPRLVKPGLARPGPGGAGVGRGVRPGGGADRRAGERQGAAGGAAAGDLRVAAHGAGAAVRRVRLAHRLRDRSRLDQVTAAPGWARRSREAAIRPRRRVSGSGWRGALWVGRSSCPRRPGSSRTTPRSPCSRRRCWPRRAAPATLPHHPPTAPLPPSPARPTMGARPTIAARPGARRHR